MGVKSTPASWVASCLVFVTAAFIRGDWLLFAVQVWKWLGSPLSEDPGNSSTSEGLMQENRSFLDRHHLQHLGYYMTWSYIGSLVSYLGFCCGLYWWFYVRQSHKEEEWKCQPGRHLSYENHKHEIILGTTNLLIGATISGLIACFLSNGGKTQMYFSLGERGYLYLAVSAVLYFLIGDGAAYYTHRYFHSPYLYKLIHKVHHRYNSPTAFSVTAMHPLEFVMYQIILASPLLFLPLHPVVFLGVVLYNYYYGVIDHSGIYMTAVWPWQPDSKFHDDHHRYFHVNFGFNTLIWDKLHKTLRRTDREYGETVFGGRGKVLEKTQ